MARLEFEVNDLLLSEVESILDSVGLDIDVAFNTFMKKIVRERGLPFSLKLEDDNKRHISSMNFQNKKVSSESLNKHKKRTITKEMLEETWKAYLNYSKGLGNYKDLSKKISENTGMNQGSAFIYLNILNKLAKGELNKRAMKPVDFEFFLNKFKHEFGNDLYQEALQSINISIPYWNSNIPTFADSMKELLKRHKKN